LLYNKKFIKVKKIGRKYNQKKIRASQKICEKIRHFDEFLEKKNCGSKVVFLVKKHSKKLFFGKLSFLKF
jgi:hypothetical protein